MAEIKIVDSGGPVVDYMARDYKSILQAMYDLAPQKLPEWSKYSNEADFGNVLLELFAHLGDILSYYQDRVANESFLGTARTRHSVIEHLRLIGYKLGTAAPAAGRLTVSVPEKVKTAVTVSKGDAFATKSEKNRPSIRFEYTGDAPINIDFNAIAPVGGRRTFDGIPVEEGRRIAGEVLGTSDGSPDQRFQLPHAGLILRPAGSVGQTGRDVVLTAQVGTVIDAWSLQDTLAFSRAGQMDYVIEIDENDRATVIFGDGSFGAKPANGAVIRATYRIGGGQAGNVPAGAIQTIVNAPQLALLEGVKIVNPERTTGGSERESIDHAVRNAPAVFRSLRRAVTATDYEVLARNLKGVGKVRAKATGWNRVTLYVAPEGGGKVSDVLEADLKAYFEDKRMVSQIIEVEDVDYVPIYVTAEIGVESYYVRSEVQARVEEVGGDLLAFDKVGFGQTIYLSKYYEEGERIDGVQYVNITEFRRGFPPGPAIDPTGKLLLGPNEVPVVPEDAAYRRGVKVVVLDQGGA